MRHGDELKAQVEAYAEIPAGEPLPKDAKHVVGALLAALEAGEIRAAVNNKGRWEAVPWVKRGILLGFRAGDLHAKGAGLPMTIFSFVDKDTYPTQQFGKQQGVRIV